MKSHTPVPWKVQDLGARAGHPKWKSFAIRCSATNVHLATVGNVDRYYEGQEEANAAFIVQACNAHEELLGACKAAAEVLATARKYFPKSIKNRDTFDLLNVEANSVRAAIAKAGGGQ